MKSIPCFICKKAVEVRDRNAIAKLCAVCNTPENQEILRKTPVRQLLRNLDEGLSERIDKVEGEYRGDFDKINSELTAMSDKIDRMKTELTTQPAPTIVTEGEVQPGLNVNEYGEVV